MDTIVIRRSVEKGTKIVIEQVKSMKWSGDEFKKSQEEKLNKIKGLKIGSAKGTSKIDLSKLYRTTIPSLEGCYISSRRGTELLKL